MKTDTPSPYYQRLLDTIERKGARYDKEAAERRERWAYAAQVDADVAAGILPAGTCRCRLSDKLGLRLEAQRRRQEGRERRAAAKADKEREKQQRQAYAAQARALTEKAPLHTLAGIHLRGKGYDLDHAVSLLAAFRAGWPVEEAAHISNLQILPTKQNTKKGTGCYSSLEARCLPMAA